MKVQHAVKTGEASANGTFHSKPSPCDGAPSGSGVAMACHLQWNAIPATIQAFNSNQSQDHIP